MTKLHIINFRDKQGYPYEQIGELKFVEGGIRIDHGAKIPFSRVENIREVPNDKTKK